MAADRAARVGRTAAYVPGAMSGCFPARSALSPVTADCGKAPAGTTGGDVKVLIPAMVWFVVVSTKTA